MNPLRADFLMTHRAIAAGATLKWPDKPPTDASDAAATKVLPSQAGIQVTLSAAAMEISALLRRTSVTDPGATAQFGVRRGGGWVVQYRFKGIHGHLQWRQIIPTND